MKRRHSTKALASFDHQYVWHPFTQMQEWMKENPIIIERAEDVYLYDTNGRRYLDGTSSIWVNVHGHRHPKIDQAIRRQLKKVAHSTMLGLASPPAILLAQKLIALAPVGLTKVFYSDDGSTAMEVAMKMAIQYWRQCNVPVKSKKKFVHLSQAYHGDTVGGMSVSGVELFQQPFHPVLFESHEIPHPHCYRCPLNLTYPSCKIDCLRLLERLLQQKHQEIAGVIIEPMVQAVAGVIPSPPGYLKRVHELCEKFHVLLIADEVATGFGRTGTMFACEHEAITPDLMAISKGLTGGYVPLAATFSTEKIFGAFLGEYGDWKTFFHGHSYTGNPIGCAAALANLEIFEEERTLKKLKKKIRLLDELLRPLKNEPIVGDIRQIGLMVGIELVKNKKTKTPFQLTDRMGHRVAKECQKRGLLIRPIGNVLVLLPPLSVNSRNLRKMVKIVEQAIQFVQNGI
ncbi:MAG: adenosylmethionine--8-amino-7-oxononanoate transaminase [Nitrospirales bacterium]|nr:adenosylmethionine--8-amino-7-oxononanoate transaminase [Nitrospira sp.]MDR4502762.1 adenosylmethionine--8-amino-7-oxononanoate transaminase [Nitrospirales bacterium]